MMAEFDVIVLGTGAAGLTAAIAAHEGGAKVGIFEKHHQVGGTTAWSGGQVWVPNNHHSADIGVADSTERALTYIMSLSHGLINRDLAEAFVIHGPEMVRFLEEHTPVKFYAVAGMPDYHAEFPGGNDRGGRTIECPLFPFKELGEWEHKVTPSPHLTGNITMSETPLGSATPKPPSETELQRRIAVNERGCGQALIGRLLKGCLDRGIIPHVSCRAKELLIHNGAITGVRFDGPDGEFDVRARRGVILATGGFEWNEEMVRTFLRGPMTRPVSIQTNTGDGLKMAMKAGAKLGNMREAWWMPSAKVPESVNALGSQMISGQRTIPHSIIVNRKGRRFTNEAANYNAFGGAFHHIDVASFQYDNIPAWMVFDQTYVDKYGFGGRFGVPGQVADWVIRANTLAELAETLDMPPQALEKTVERWNRQVEAGEDTDYQRGNAAHDRWWGDPTKKGTKEGTLGSLTTGPYYALELHPGCIGTKGGPATDVNGQVLDTDGKPIGGLYAAGNAMASPMGMTYGGPGGTLGPAMTFGYLAGRHSAQISNH